MREPFVFRQNSVKCAVGHGRDWRRRLAGRVQ
jgi:hypothetical protein